MTRTEAIEILAQHDVSRLGPEEREALLLDWWTIDENDPEYDSLPDVVRVALQGGESPNDPQNRLFDPLLRLACRRSLDGVVNAYLERRLAELGHRTTVEGLVEALETCPCCAYRSLRERGGYEICRVCFWEDDGTTDSEVISGPNRMTLREARRNFNTFGAVSEAALQHVLRDGRDRYPQGER